MASALAGAATFDVAVRNVGATTPIYRGLDQAALDHAYDERAAVPDWEAAIAHYRAGTAAARALLAPGTARYGMRAHEALDIYAPEGARGAAIMVFIHGGGWHALSRDESGFAAPAFVAAGVVFVALDFTPVPECSLAELLNAARRAIKWLHAHAAAHGGDPARIHLCGHGSGAHVAAMLAGTNWRHCGLPADLIKSATLVGGIYDLEPLQLSARNATLQLDRVGALRLSPIRCLPPPHCRVLVAHAARETAALARQSDAYALAVRATGGRVETVVVAGHDHFTAIETLADPKSVLGTAALELARG
jgi:arylformamidase